MTITLKAYQWPELKHQGKYPPDKKNFFSVSKCCFDVIYSNSSSLLLVIIH